MTGCLYCHEQVAIFWGCKYSGSHFASLRGTMMHIVLFLLSHVIVLLNALVPLYVITSGLPLVPRVLCLCFKKKKYTLFLVFENRGVTLWYQSPALDHQGKGVS